MPKDAKKPKKLPPELLEASKKINIDEIVGSLAHDKIILQNNETLNDSDKIKALRAAAKIGKAALARGDFKVFQESVELAASLLEDF